MATQPGAPQATIEFVGTVQRLGESTVAGLEATDRMAVVRVDRVLKAPRAFASMAGREITVLLQDPASLQVGEQAVFSATSWLLGDSIAVQEVDHRGVETLEEVAAPPGGPAEPAAEFDDDQVAARLQEAQVVVVGRVAEVRPSTTAPSASTARTPPSEHDPQWWEAEIDVEQAVKGEVSPGKAVVLFPASRDVMWHRAPKFAPGQQGVWLLHREQVPQHAEEALQNVFTALDPRDFHPRESVGRVRRLVERTNR